MQLGVLAFPRRRDAAPTEEFEHNCLETYSALPRKSNDVMRIIQFARISLWQQLESICAEQRFFANLRSDQDFWATIGSLASPCHAHEVLQSHLAGGKMHSSEPRPSK